MSTPTNRPKKTSTASSSRSKKAASKPKKTSGSRKKSAARRAPKRSAARAEPSEASRSLVAALPSRLAEVTYVSRTRDIFAKRQRRAQRLRQDTRRELRSVLDDLRSDAVSAAESARDDVVRRAEGAVAKARDTRVGHEVERVSSDVTDRAHARIDAWLDRVGLVRKARLAG